MKKSGQMQISFGMIFSIILIVAFIAFAFYGIKMFLGIQEKAKISNFKEDFQNDINRVWQSSASSLPANYSLPGKIEQVCISDSEIDNLILKPELAYPGLSRTTINHVDSSSLSENPYCIEKRNGQISLLLKKDFGQNLVEIIRR